MIACINIKKSFGLNNVLDNIIFDVAENEKVAIVGRNGQGKTTLFKIITNEILKDQGEVVLPKGKILGYTSQMPPLTNTNTIYQELLTVFNHLEEKEKELLRLSEQMANNEQSLLRAYDKLTKEYEDAGGYIYKSKIKGVIAGLGFGDANHYIDGLSGGQKTKLAMAKLFLTKPDILLLDEPTNHLDLESIGWLEDFLKDYSGTVIFISHDRYFINRVSNKIIEIENGYCKTYKGDYEFYLHKKEEEFANALKNYGDQQKIIKKQEESIRLLKSFNREKSVRRAESKEKALEKMDKLEKPKNAPSKMHFTLNPKISSGNDVLKVENLSKEFSGKYLFKNINFEIKKGEKIALIGPVGTGKTTLLKLIIENNAGVHLGTNVQMAYYDQNLENSLNQEVTILEEVHSAYPRLNVIDIRNVLAAFVFVGDDVYKKIGGLSGGEKARVSLAKIMLTGANFLILDEPTNHLDISSKSILEEALIDYRGTLLYISHDRYFINKTAEKIIELTPNGTHLFLGDYDYYLDKKKKNNSTIVAKTEKFNENKERWQDKKIKESTEKKIKNKIARLEKAIEEHEMQLEALEIELMKVADDHVKSYEIFNKKIDLEKNLEQLYTEWESLHNNG